ncbi:hypothetical protein SS50377_23588 [Spironucleus salmonicida]|uniref:Uncharacterized protein n=1 Tax=Spironucleus salmonicida TaxID=348837 RepID=V6LXX9_9EUKA|nr:hypothetical protein SS50377_23588 [Spironucleus salmonicida]|eukprot:EST48571.1 hypothetical protein SS50377_11182 [Spironucleus salmonicida]
MHKVSSQIVIPQMAQILSKYSQYTVQQLINDHTILDNVLQEQRKSFPWEQLALQTGLSKQQVYRWYFDNFQRHLFGNIEKSDMNIIRTEVYKLLKDCSDITKEMQFVIKQKLSKQYHRNSFTIAFNNAKNTLKKVFSFKNQSQVPIYRTPIPPQLQDLSNIGNFSTLHCTFEVLDTKEEPEFMWSLNQDWCI